MSQRTINWGLLIAALGLAGTVALFISRSVADAEVAPVAARVGVVENQQQNDGKRLERIEDKVDRIYDALTNRGSR